LIDVLKNNLVEGEDVVRVGMTSLGVIPDDWKYMVEQGIQWHPQAEIEKDCWDAVLQRVFDDVKDIENLPITVDLDMIASAHFPATGGREPDGPTPSKMMKMLRALAIQNNVILTDFAEYNPMLDSKNNQSAVVTIKLMTHFLTGLAARNRALHYQFSYNLWLPTGRYNEGASKNVGKGLYSHLFTSGVTWVAGIRESVGGNADVALRDHGNAARHRYRVR
jgi:hypothetical protein